MTLLLLLSVHPPPWLLLHGSLVLLSGVKDKRHIIGTWALASNQWRKAPKCCWRMPSSTTCHQTWPHPQHPWKHDLFFWEGRKVYSDEGWNWYRALERILVAGCVAGLPVLLTRNQLPTTTTTARVLENGGPMHGDGCVGRMLCWLLSHPPRRYGFVAIVRLGKKIWEDRWLFS